jgi:predicted nucleic acid-binding Zn ribbon protein
VAQIRREKSRILHAMINNSMKNRVTKPGLIAANKKTSCKYCTKETTLGNIKRHEDFCYLNPDNIKHCAVCNSIIKNYKSSKGTCSRSCANTFFKSGENNGNFKGDSYQFLCFSNHKKECVVCGENKIVAVHHLNENHEDNTIENLIPMCPTHHQYMHSKYKKEILHVVEEYVKNFKARLPC